MAPGDSMSSCSLSTKTTFCASKTVSTRNTCHGCKSSGTTKIKTECQKVVVYFNTGSTASASMCSIGDRDDRPRWKILGLAFGGGQGVDHGVDALLHDLTFRNRNDI